ncbi:MAG: hypothetical protein ABMA15_02555 [Vicinamibacterales bacterium]
MNGLTWHAADSGCCYREPLPLMPSDGWKHRNSRTTKSTGVGDRGGGAGGGGHAGMANYQPACQGPLQAQDQHKVVEVQVTRAWKGMD